MILEMKVPSPGESITEVEIAQWLVSDGDYVEKDQAIAEVDSDETETLCRELLDANPQGVADLKEGKGKLVFMNHLEGQPLVSPDSHLNFLEPMNQALI